MTGRIYTTDFTVPAGTAIASPVSQAVTLDDVQLDLVQVVIPDGHVYATGLAITWGGTQVAPYIQGTWIVGNNERLDYPYDGEITAAGLVLRGYNLGVYAHTFHIRWYCTLLASVSPVVIASPQLSGPPQPDAVAAIAAMTGSVA